MRSSVPRAGPRPVSATAAATTSPTNTAVTAPTAPATCRWRGVGLVHTTVTLPSVSYPIAKDALEPGDILNNPLPGTSGHVVLFAGWADAAKTRYFAYEESPSGRGAAQRGPLPYWPGYGTFTPAPLHRNHLEDSRDSAARGPAAEEARPGGRRRLRAPRQSRCTASSVVRRYRSARTGKPGN